MHLEVVHNKIYEIRGIKIMLDFDLAQLFEVETRVLNQAIKRNLDSFPEDFMFRLSKIEWDSLLSEIEISSSQTVMMKELPKNRTGKYLPYVFTEHGVTMLASVLKSPKARKMNITIVRAFVALKEFALNNKEIAAKLKDIEEKCDKQFQDIYEALNYLISEKEQESSQKNRNSIGYKNEN
jgi:hypothetical protein